MLDIGTRLSGRYRIESVLGKGGMGAVYLGTVESLGGKQVAIKEMEVPPAAGRSQEQAIAQFKKEATFLAHLDHPNLVKVTDFFADGDKHYLVMDYVEGETLQQMLEDAQKPFLWEELRVHAESLMEVLSYLHSQDPPILFRDLKPANIMVQPSGRVKLIDFGIARTATPGMETSTFLKGTGTNGFSPIEQYGMGETTDQRSDIYAFGATIYYLLSGKIPPEAIGRVSGGKELIPLHKLNPDVSQGLSKVIAKCMAVKQKDRYANMALVREMMIQATAAAAAPEMDSAFDFVTAEPPPQNDNSSVWAAALATMGVAAAVMMIIVVHYVTNLADEQQVAATRTPAVSATIEYQDPAPVFVLPSTGAPQPQVVPKTRIVVAETQELEPRVVKRSVKEPPVEIRIKPKKRTKPKKRVVKATFGDEPVYPKAEKAEPEFEERSGMTQPDLQRLLRERRSRAEFRAVPPNQRRSTNGRPGQRFLY